MINLFYPIILLDSFWVHKMKDQHKRKDEPTNELVRMRRRVTESETECKRAEEELEQSFETLRRAEVSQRITGICG